MEIRILGLNFCEFVKHSQCTHTNTKVNLPNNLLWKFGSVFGNSLRLSSSKDFRWFPVMSFIRILGGTAAVSGGLYAFYRFRDKKQQVR